MIIFINLNQILWCSNIYESCIFFLIGVGKPQLNLIILYQVEHHKTSRFIALINLEHFLC
jgi:hypothetical protein